MNKILIDTNIFIYDLDKSSIFHDKAKKIIQDESLELSTTSKNISEFFAVCTKLNIDEKIMFGYYEDILSNILILFPEYHSLNIFKELLKINKPKGNRVFDFEIVSIMLSNGILQIATMNIEDFKKIKEITIYKN
ncbi:MAG: type II toxin-antitoxin system VapC family toxin [bacterium]